MHIKKNLFPLLFASILSFVIQPALASDDSLSPAQAQAGSLLWQMQQGYTTATLLNTEGGV